MDNPDKLTRRRQEKQIQKIICVGIPKYRSHHDRKHHTWSWYNKATDKIV